MFHSDNSTPHTAANYDEQVHKTIPYYDCFHQETLNLISAMELQPKSWLDTGCGTGTLVEKALKLFPDTSFVLVDPSPQMLNAAKGKLVGYPNVAFLEANTTQQLSNLKEKFDVITAIQSHHYSSEPQREEATKVCFKLLSPKGVYVTFENIQPFTQQGIAIGLENWKQRQIQAGRETKTAEKHMKRFGVEYFPITVEDHLALLRRTGFSVVELLWYSVMQAGFYCVK
jgi:tRNA (cmo5U34)-methyltransferase